MLRHYPLNPATGLEDAAMLPWTNGNPSTGEDGSYPPFGLFTDGQEAIIGAQNAAGLAAADDPTQLAQALSRGLYLGGFTGTADALAAALPNGLVFPALLTGMRFVGTALVTNTGAATLTLTGLGPAPATLPLRRRDGAVLQAGDVPVGVPFGVIFDGAAFRFAHACPSEIRANAVVAALPYTPAGAKKATAFTTFALTTITGVNADNVAQTLAVSGASYIDVTGATSIYYNATSGSTDRVGVIARIALFQGATLVADGDYHIGSVLSPLESAPLVLRQVFQGLDPAKTYTIKLIVDKSQPVDNINVNDAYLIAYYG